MSEHLCQDCGTPSRLDERFCARCGLLFPALAPVEPITQETPVIPATGPLQVPATPRPRRIRPGASVSAPSRPHRRGLLVRLVAALVVIAGAISALSLTASPTAEDRVRSVFERQVAAIQAGRFAQAHARFSPDVRRACPVDDWVAGFDAFHAAGGDLSLLAYAGVEVRVSGDGASVTYSLLYDGRVLREVAGPEPDRYVRIDGQWFDAADPSTACGLAVSPGRSLV